MQKKIIFLTTSITRGDYHRQSIGDFYNRVIHYFNNYKIYHVINIDSPLKLRNKYNIEETKNLLKEIIPSKVDVIFTEKYNENPSFGEAYINVIKSMYENNLFTKKSYIWWLEDDWRLIKTYNFTLLINLLDCKSCSAINITDKAPLCSLRGGPIMNSAFFKTFFDLSKKYKNNFNPELKINRNIRFNRTIPIYNNDFYIICIYFLNKTVFPYDMNESCYWHYKRKYYNITKFKQGKEIKFVISFIENENSDFIYFKISNNITELKIENKKQLNTLSCRSIDDFKVLMENSTLNYISIVPHLLKDIGRKFNKKNNLISPKDK